MQTEEKIINKLRFTPTEWEIIRHRLEVPFAIWEAHFQHSDNPDMRDISSSIVTRICERLLTYKHQFEGVVGPIEREIIIEAAEGSVFMPLAETAYLENEISKGKLLAYKYAAKRIERKLEVSIPRT